MLPANVQFAQPVPPTAQMLTAPAESVVPPQGIVQTSQAVPSLPVSKAVQNNTQSSQNSKQSAQPQAAPAPSGAGIQAGTSIPPIPAAIAGGVGSISSLFVAQLMAQNIDTPTQSVLAGYEQMVVASQVKYKPSNASLPQQPGPGDAFRLMLTDQAPPAQRMAANQVQQVAAQQANENMARPVAANISTAAVSKGVQQTRLSDLAPSRDVRRNEPTATRLQKSLLFDSGARAYRATDVRNVIHLELDEPIRRVG